MDKLEWIKDKAFLIFFIFFALNFLIPFPALILAPMLILFGILIGWLLWTNTSYREVPVKLLIALFCLLIICSGILLLMGDPSFQHLYYGSFGVLLVALYLENK